MTPNVQGQTPYVRWLARISILLLLAQAAYVTGWAIVDIMVRLELWPRSTEGWDAYSFFASLSFWQEAAFFSSTLLALVSVWLHWRRSFWVLPVYFLSYLLYRLDSFLLTLNSLFNGIAGVETFAPMLILQLALLLALILLWGEGYFDQDRLRFWRKGPPADR
ncbi:hypothetical protein [Maricaulis maris]|uniref:hypothetical protein n=1 Tax=Maricaulis maris TaxID=74318 RepID=UPI003B8E59DB